MEDEARCRLARVSESWRPKSAQKLKLKRAVEESRVWSLNMPLACSDYRRLKPIDLIDLATYIVTYCPFTYYYSTGIGICA